MAERWTSKLRWLREASEGSLAKCQLKKNSYVRILEYDTDGEACEEACCARTGRHLISRNACVESLGGMESVLKMG